MPIAAFTFGSLGDITAILQLAWAIRQSLSETAGASAQVQTLIMDIDAFTGALQQIKAALNNRSSVPPDLMNGIALALGQCSKLLLRVKQRIDAYNSRMTGAVGAGALRQYWAAVAWEILGGKREVDALRAGLSEQLEVVQTLLAAAHSQNLEEIRKAAAAHRHAFLRPHRIADTSSHSQKLENVQKGSENAHRNVREMFSSMRELCIRLSATSTPFTFFDTSGAQLMPAGILHMSEDPRHFLRVCSNLTTSNLHGPSGPPGGLLYASVQFWYDEGRGHYLVSSRRYYRQPALLGGYPDEKHTLVVLFSFSCHCGGEDEELVAFVSPVYTVTAGRNKDTSRAVLVPEASAALSGYIRCRTEVKDPSSDLAALFDVTAEPQCVSRVLNLE